MRETEDVEFGGVDIIGEFVDAENKEIARRHADLQRKNQVLELLADVSLPLPQEFSSNSPLIKYNINSTLDSSQLSCDLWEAANCGRADTTKLLLASGADPNRLVPILSLNLCTLFRKGPG